MKWRLIGAVFGAGLLMASSAEACRMTPRQISKRDVLHAPMDMVAVQAVIKNVQANDAETRLPHSGFTLDLEVQKTFQTADLKDREFTVHYSGCHALPGKVGDVIYVLASKHENGTWYAPSSWKLHDEE